MRCLDLPAVVRLVACGALFGLALPGAGLVGVRAEGADRRYLSQLAQQALQHRSCAMTQQTFRAAPASRAHNASEAWGQPLRYINRMLRARHHRRDPELQPQCQGSARSISAAPIDPT